jgi:hypothetical protein
MSGGLAGTYFTLLQQFDQKAIPEPTGDNTQIQKVAAPTDSAIVGDTSLIITTIQTPPFKYGVARYGQAQYGAMYENVILADKPVVYYRMDERAFPEVLDWSGNGNNGTIGGGVTPRQPGAIADGDTAMEFDGSTGHVSVNSVPVTATTASIEAWLKWDGTYPSGGWAIPITFGSNYDLAFNSNGTFGVNTGISDILGFSSAGMANLWTHIVAVVPNNAAPTPSNTRIYMNGVLQTISLTTGGPSTNIPITNLDLGMYNGTGFPYAGMIDEVAIYNTTLSADQVQRHYNAASWK